MEKDWIYKGSRIYIPLITFCPKSFSANGCEKTLRHWSWVACSHIDYIDDQGNCHCLKCDKEHFL